MMNDNMLNDEAPINSEVTAVVANYNRVADAKPFGGAIEFLIEIPLKTECFVSDRTSKFKIVEPFFKR